MPTDTERLDFLQNQVSLSMTVWDTELANYRVFHSFQGEDLRAEIDYWITQDTLRQSREAIRRPKTLREFENEAG